jgi:hypothetical protein
MKLSLRMENMKDGHVVQPVGAPDRVPPPIKWTLSTNDKEGVYDGESENEKGGSVQ